jgi:hypothetical protein
MKRSLYMVREAGVVGAEVEEDDGRGGAPEEDGQADCAPEARREEGVDAGVGGFELAASADDWDGDGGRWCWWCSMAELGIGRRMGVWGGDGDMGFLRRFRLLC